MAAFRSLTTMVLRGDVLPVAFPTAAVRCPRCRCRKVVGHGRWRGRRRYRCRACRRTFNALTGTPMARLHYPGRWLELAVCMMEGVPVREAARRLGVHPSTAFRWRHRVLAALAGDGGPRAWAREAADSALLPGTPFLLHDPLLRDAKGVRVHNSRGGRRARSRLQLRGIVEVSEVVFAYSEKGNRRLNRPPRRRGLLFVEPWSVAKVYAVVARDRRGRILSAVTGVGPPRHDVLTTVFAGRVAPGTVLCPPRPQDYRLASRQLGLVDGFLNPRRYWRTVRISHWHRQGAAALGVRLRGWMRRFNGVSTRYLHRYLAWYAFLEQAPAFQPDAAGDQLLRTVLNW